MKRSRILFRLLTAVLIAALCVTALPLASVSAASLGDVNGDGNITIGDTLLVFRHVNGRIALTSDKLARADSNFDGTVNIADAVFWFRYINGRHSSLPTPPTTTTRPPLGDDGYYNDIVKP